MELQECSQTHALGALPTPLSVFIKIYYDRYQKLKKNRPVEEVVSRGNPGIYPHSTYFLNAQQRVRNNERESLQHISGGVGSSPYAVQGEHDIASLIRTAIEYSSEDSLDVLAKKLENPTHVYNPSEQSFPDTSNEQGSYSSEYQMIWWNWWYLKEFEMKPTERMDAAILAAFCQAKKDEEIHGSRVFGSKN